LYTVLQHPPGREASIQPCFGTLNRHAAFLLTYTIIEMAEKSATQKLFERNMLVVRINSERPKFWDTEAMLDSLAVGAPVPSSFLHVH
jgi:hypothetical protein